MISSLLHASSRLLCGSLLLAAAATAQAQEWPSRPLRMLVGSSPGGGTDAMAWAVETPITIVWPSVDLAVTSAARVFEAPGRFSTTTVAFVGAVPNVLVVNNELGVTSVAQLVEMARKQPGKLNYASSGSGSTQHIAAELFKEATGTFITHIPYRGSSPALIDLMGGQVQMSFDTLASVLGHIRSGKVKALAVAAAKRNPQLPDVPTLAEAGVKGVEMSAWYGVYMPAATPKAIQQRVHEEVNKLLPLADTRSRLAAIGSDVAPLTQAEFVAFHEAENKRYAEVIRKRGIKLD
jgi:tripartite-type tricarboxylate transporter receptor subunit TctC